MLRPCLRRLRPPLSRAWHSTSPHRFADAATAPDSSVTTNALRSIKEYVLGEVDPASVEHGGNIDIRDAFSRPGTAKPAPQQQDPSVRVPPWTVLVDLPKNSAAAYVLVPDRSKPIFRDHNKMWHDQADNLANPNHYLGLEEKEVSTVLIALVMNWATQARAIHLLKYLVQRRSPDRLKHIFNLPTIERLADAANNASAARFLHALVDIMFRLYFPQHSYTSPFPERWDSNVPRMDLDRWLPRDWEEKRAQTAAAASEIPLEQQPLGQLDSDQKKVANRIFHYVLETYFQRHLYSDVVVFHGKMVECGLSPAVGSYNRVLQSHFRYFLYADVYRSLRKQVTFDQLMRRVQSTLNDMQRHEVLASNHTRSILLFGMARSLLLSPVSDLMHRWAAIGPALQRLRAYAWGNAMVRITWTEACLELVESRKRRVDNRQSNPLYDHAPPLSEMERIQQEWFHQTFNAMQEHLKVSGTGSYAYNKLSIPEVASEVSICFLNMRAAIVQDNIESAASWLQQLRPGYEHASQRIQLPENSRWHSFLDPLDTRYEAATIRFVVYALGRRRIDHALGAMNFSAYLRNTFTFVQLWRRILNSQAQLNLGWNDPNGVHQALQLFMNNIEQHPKFSVVDPTTGVNQSLRQVFPSNERQIAYHVWAAMVGPSAGLRMSRPFQLPDPERLERLEFLRKVFTRCGVAPSEQFWSAEQSRLAELYAMMYPDRLKQDELDKVRRVYEGHPIPGSDDQGSFRFFGVKFTLDNK